MPMMATIPPGLDIRPNLQHNVEDGTQFRRSPWPSAGIKSQGVVAGNCLQSPGCSAISRFLVDSSKPIILAICHSSCKENVFHLLNAYGSCSQLVSASNLVILFRMGKDVPLCSANDDFMERILKSIDDFDLYGSVAYPKNYCVVRWHSFQLWCDRFFTFG